MQLVIGNKNYSSWSLRPWLLLHAHGIEFTEIRESLNQQNIRERLGKYSGSCKVPVLIDGNITIWDSLAICEYVSDNYLYGAGWPEDRKHKAEARSVCAEMHSGFMALRSELPMNCRLQKEVTIPDAVKEDIRRIESIWSTYAMESEHGVRLFGRFGIADCFYVPVILRFNTYNIPLSGMAAKYAADMIEHPSVKHWLMLAGDESEVIPEDEI